MTYKPLFTAHQEDGVIIITPAEGAKIRLREKEIKPLQMDKQYYVECTPEQREEIIRIADEYGRPVYEPSRKSVDRYPNLVWNMGQIAGTYATKEDDPNLAWIPIPEFIARLKGEWVEKPEPDEIGMLVTDENGNKFRLVPVEGGGE